MSRWFWHAYAALTALVVLGFVLFAAGPAIERRLAPIRTNSRMTDIERSPGLLCWTWSGDKERAAPFTAIDVFLDHANGDLSFPEIFNRDTGEPWHKGGTLPVGHSAVAFCTHLTPNVSPSERLVLRQVLHYRGFMGLWDVPIALPDVVSEGVPP